MVALALTTVATTAPCALATYRGGNGTLAYQVNTNDPNSGNVVDSGISSISSSSKANCDDPTGDQAPCEIGRLSYSPDGTMIVAERSGQLEVLDDHGMNVTVLKQLTSSDTEPAFLPNATTIAFAGTVNGHQNLYTVHSDGAGLKPLTTNGGSWPAPCGNGSIAFVNHGALYLRHADGSVGRLARRGVLAADCAPNSKSIAFATSRHIFIVKTRGEKSRRLKHGDGAAYPCSRQTGPASPPCRAFQTPNRVGTPSTRSWCGRPRTAGGSSKHAIGDNLGVITGGPLHAWQPKP